MDYSSRMVLHYMNIVSYSIFGNSAAEWINLWGIQNHLANEINK